MIGRLARIVVLFAVAVSAHAAEPPVEHITYDEFLHAVESGRIKEVRFYNIGGLEGEMQSPSGIVRFDSGYSFQPVADPLLLRLLKEKDVKIERTEESKFPRSGFGYNSWQLMQLGFLMTTALLVIAILQLRILRRLDKKG